MKFKEENQLAFEMIRVTLKNLIIDKKIKFFANKIEVKKNQIFKKISIK